MQIIGLVMQKGGAGKTTAALALAGALAKKHKVALIDLDKQASISTWSGDADIPSSLEVFKASSVKDLKGLSGFDYVVVDTVGVLSGDVIPYLDLALIPITPSPLDVWAAADTVALVKLRPALKAAFLVNRMQSNTVLGKEIVEVISGYGINILKAQLSMRAAYPLSLAKKKLPVDTPGIRLECLRLAEAVKTCLGDK